MGEKQEHTGAPNLPTLATLKPWQRQFVDAYVSDPKRNGTKAFLAAKPGVAYDSAHVGAHRLLRNVTILAAIKELEEYARSADNLLPRCVARLSQIAFQDRYVTKPDPGEPVLPGLEEAMAPQVVKVQHGDSIQAVKALLQIGGVELVESLSLRGRVGLDAEHDLSEGAMALFEKISGGPANANA